MKRIPIRELRNQASEAVRRVRAGERFLITVDGVPAAEIGPVRSGDRVVTLEDLIATGQLSAPTVRTPPQPAKPLSVRSGRSSSEVLRELRAR